MSVYSRLRASAQNIVDNDYAGLNQNDVDAIKAAPAIASSKRFFHWELEFPEIYFDERECKEDGGFDAVVGNPPYVRWELVRKNRARVEVNLVQAGLKERVLARYEESLGRVLPLKVQLGHTDALIDRVVYRLYGLTEEEIAVVEVE